MTKLPLTLRITQTGSDKVHELVCNSVLRNLPGKRNVYAGTWNTAGVIIKIFYSNLSAGRHLSKELTALTELHRRGIDAPKPLLNGKTYDGHRVLVTEQITDSSEIFELFQQTKSLQDRLVLLVHAVKAIALMNKAGVAQNDLHLGNFLIRDDRIFCLDPARMSFYRRPLDKNKSLAQLALLLTNIPPDAQHGRALLINEYFKYRGRQPTDSDLAILSKMTDFHTHRIHHKSLKKIFRTGKRYVRISHGGFRAVFSRDFANRTTAAELIDKIDTLMDKGRILKNGGACYVSSVIWNNADVVIKRYNHKGLLHSVRHTIKQSRAKRNWLAGHRLLMLGIATAKPLGYIEIKKGPLVWQSYIITEFVQGPKLDDFLADKAVLRQDRQNTIGQVDKLLERLAKNRITHGDLKQANIIVSPDGPILIDLDSIKTHRYSMTYRRKRKKDMAAFENIEYSAAGRKD